MLHRFPYRLNSRIATRRPQPGAMVAMRVLTFVPVQGANFSFEPLCWRSRGSSLGLRNNPGLVVSEMRTFWSRCQNSGATENVGRA